MTQGNVVTSTQAVPACAIVRGEALLQLPADLYIPPDALEVILDAFEGPLDLLLYLIRRQNLDILDIPMTELTKQYMAYVDLIKHLRLELAADYLVMAATLAEIKSRMLLPRPANQALEEEDPRMQLIRRLQEYECFKAAAQSLEVLPRAEREFFIVKVTFPEQTADHFPVASVHPDVSLKELLLAFQAILKRAELVTHHPIAREPLSIRERMSTILQKLDKENFLEFSKFFTVNEGKMGIVVTLIAILELLRQTAIELVQNQPYSPIYIRSIQS